MLFKLINRAGVLDNMFKIVFHYGSNFKLKVGF